MKKKDNQLRSILLMALFFSIAIVLVISNIIESGPSGRFIEEAQTPDSSKQTAINLGIVVISLICIISIAVHYLVKFSENALKHFH